VLTKHEILNYLLVAGHDFRRIKL